MTLQLSAGTKRRIHAVMRGRLRSGPIVGGTIVIALLVTLFEFSCTGQVYVPVLLHLARNEHAAGAYALIGIYNVAFIAPLVAVFLMVYSGYTVSRISRFFSQRVALVKTMLAGVFLSFALLTLVTT
jgi:cytochrome c biogenesis protein CcdA